MDTSNNGDEFILKKALQEARSSNPSRAARENHLSRSSLRHRIQGRVSRRDIQKKNQRLTEVQEEDLVQWILSEEIAGRAPTKNVIRSMAQLVIQEAGQTKPLGINWVDKFIKRHKEIKAKPARLIEASRMHSTTKDALKTHAL